MNVFERMLLRKETMNYLKAHWGTISAVGGGLIAFLMPSLQMYAAAHPKEAIGLVVGCVITAYNLSAPKDKLTKGSGAE
jgi:hypothetical protein